MNPDILASRRSIRRFTAERPGRDILTRLIEAATLAPSASNKQPWRFFMVDDPALIGALADAVQKAVDRTTRKLIPDFAGAFSDYAGYFVRFREAPALIVPAFKSLTVLSHLVEATLTAEEQERIDGMELYSGLISTSLAIQNLMLRAHSLGLGTSCMTGPLLAEGELKNLLGIPPAWRIAALIPVGYPDETPAPVARKPAESVMRWVEPVSGTAQDEGEGKGNGRGDGKG